MDFFKRIFSLSGRRKKDKRKQSHGPLVTDAEGRILRSEDQVPDTDATRLLRSASARWASTDAVQSLAPPSVNHLSVPASPAQSLQTLASSLKRSNTYSVQVLSRTQHSRTEFPNANPRIDDRKQPCTPQQTHDQHITDNAGEAAPALPAMKAVTYTPRDENRLRALRRDPSVLSLLNMYDNHGRLDEHAFSNSPPNSAPIQEGREQTKRGGSTLRQLLGDAEMRGEATERDISWADRFLQQAGSAVSSTSSLPLVTPDNADNAFIHCDTAYNDRSASAENSSELLDGHPAISSLEVEVSGTSDVLDPDQPIPVADNPVTSPKTPQQANHVFGFLSERRRSVRSQTGSAYGFSTITLPQLDSASTSSQPSQPTSDSSPQTPSFEESHWHTNISHAEVKTATVMKLSTAPAAVCSQAIIGAKAPVSATAPSVAEAPMHKLEFLEFPELQRATTGSSVHSNVTRRSSTAQPSRIPRGPRPRRSKQSLSRDLRQSQTELPLDLQRQLENTVTDTQLGRTASGQSQRPGRPYGPRAAESSKSVDTFTAVVPRKHRRSTSRTSLVNDQYNDVEEIPPPLPPKSAASRAQRSAHRKKPPRAPRDDDKENSDVTPNPSPALARSKSAAMPGASVSGPSTPTRTRSVLDARYRNDLADVPSPASSSELSPIAKDMMDNLRKQRLRLQNVARRSGRGLRSAS
ncbi:uncharacterized protein B0H18DRAFT_1118638 [Fomitopsis serialis]|uniref:uncharacterized protein n=1 Tax=Fomitopsis serialis TaxID=139415 RepID=UPI002007DD4D|nr:uncharacterized protein B0H18DRAFT_1118638 [Neoantrodia serialis]KAH9926877.1 hypothetical protein B0H18DRAFT_1118638 [Neoantrodia serialis]